MMAWRYDIQYGADGEANYAWVYDDSGNMVCTAKIHHAVAIVEASTLTARRIQAMQTVEITPAMFNLDEALIRSATGVRDEETHYLWSSLWQLTDKERADIGKIDAETIAKLNETGLFPPEALANAGANMLVEHSIMPGLLEEIDNAGGLPDYEAELEAEREAQAAAANANRPQRQAANDGVTEDRAEPKPLYVRRDVVNAAAIKRHYAEQGLTVTVNNLHVTLIYSKMPMDWFAAGEPWEEEVKIKEGGPRDHALFGPPGLEDSLVLMVASNLLKWRHEEFIRAGASSSYPDGVYRPHITLRYKDGGNIENWEDLEPYRGEIVLGPEIFEEVAGKVVR